VSIADGGSPEILGLKAEVLPSRAEELSSLMLGWRLRLQPEQVPGLFVHRRRRKGRVSQEEVAALAGISAPWYGYLERGDVSRRYSTDILDRVAFVLRLSDDERRVLHLLATAQEPPAKELGAEVEISPALQATLSCQPWPAWISDPSWRRIALNSATHAWFPHTLREDNVMRWVFKYPASRVQLCNWETVWAPRMLAQMRAALAKWPDDQGLQQIVAESLEVNDFARHWWSTSHEVVQHPDGDRRELYLPNAGEPTKVEIVAKTPMRYPDLRLVEVVPYGGYIPPECRPWLSGDHEPSS
jgi:transcriptional regulator with XRE-family HTH domain